MSEPTPPGASSRFVPLAIVALAVLYVLALAAGWPQYGRQAIVGQQAQHGEAPAHAEAAPIEAPPLWTVIPFVLMLGAIAVLPLVPAAHHWWESNRSKLLVAGGLALVALAYYAFLHESALEGHWPAHHVLSPGAG